jgi:hypothetical protein
MSKYENGKVYKLWSPNFDMVYVGSTINTLSQRLSGHKSSFKLYQYAKSTYITSFEILIYDNVKIELIELCPCNNKEELLKYEANHIKQMNCVNKNIPGRNKFEWRIDYKDEIQEYNKQYYLDNNEVIREYSKKWRLVNLEYCSEYQKQHYQNNKEMLLKRQIEYNRNNPDYIKQYNNENKDKLQKKSKEKITCDICGCVVNKAKIKRHHKSEKCLIIYNTI